MAVHPDKVTIATGQVAGHDRQEGKVQQRQLGLLTFIFIAFPVLKLYHMANVPSKLRAL